MNYWMEEFIREQERECLAEYKKLNIPDVSTRFLNIAGIMETSDEAESSFFNWLTSNGIWWTQRGSDLRNITVYEKDIQTIKNTWHEVNVC